MSKRVGCDFGVRPRYAILTDVTFVNHLKAHQALGYGVLPSFGLLIKPPVLYYLFADVDSARECFTVFKRWVDHSNDGDAVSLTFIEFDDGAYGLITAPDLDRLIDRTLPSSIREEFEPLAITATFHRISWWESFVLHYALEIVRSYLHVGSSTAKTQ